MTQYCIHLIYLINVTRKVQITDEFINIILYAECSKDGTRFKAIDYHLRKIEKNFYGCVASNYEWKELK